MAEAPPTTLGDYFSVKHGFAFKGEHFTEEPTPDVLVTPGNFAIGGGKCVGIQLLMAHPFPLLALRGPEAAHLQLHPEYMQSDAESGVTVLDDHQFF